MKKIYGGKCMCGKKLPDVFENETPYEFCSQKCANNGNKYLVAVHIKDYPKHFAEIFGFPTLKDAKEFGRMTGREFAIAKAINPPRKS